MRALLYSYSNGIHIVCLDNEFRADKLHIGNAVAEMLMVTSLSPFCALLNCLSRVYSFLNESVNTSPTYESKCTVETVPTAQISSLLNAAKHLHLRNVVKSSLYLFP